MKLRYKVTAVIVFASLFATATHAEDTPRIGLGTGFSSSGSISTMGFEMGVEEVLTPVSVYIPLDLGGVRFEPEIGYLRSSESDNNIDHSIRTFQFGTGIFGQHELTQQTRFYYGARLGLSFNYQDVEAPAHDDSESSTDVYIGPAIGSEYFPADEFSIGGEAQLLYSSIDQPEIDISIMNTRATLFMRVYF